ncbi:MAG: cobalt transport protein CbiM [Candidatus Methanofastidiosum methylothiophilum]|uniref:Cobalt transport protein CbiM n=1 Tax=Candidatus Methanofastidiosum methylothiophilum TaxID=1705564 RepID=A0A150IYG2_9EURY|nr:MAG: cobalt transport protein CbiM [Candidatus Methanofastidiosum methylthiophilus]KYC49999.1 MAG: cobalt transport protein CbiM [Candidatus Methanofastidiosum methylthiophilus]
MHIPDGFLDMNIAVLYYLLTAIVVGICIYKIKKDGIDEKRVPIAGLVAAGIFAAQMLNWPIPGGTSAHFVGGAVAAIILGPFLGCIAMVSVVSIQALVFGDGGITALGTNLFSMAIVGVFVAYYIYKALNKYNTKIAAFVAGWIGITLGAINTGIATGLSSTFQYAITTTVPIMGIWHGILGIIEGLITVAIIAYIEKNREDILYISNKTKNKSRSGKK